MTREAKKLYLKELLKSSKNKREHKEPFDEHELKG